MKLFLSSLAITASVGIWMVVVATSQLALLDKVDTIEQVSGAISNPINRALKQDRLVIHKVGTTKDADKVDKKAGDFCDVGGFDRACKFQIADLKVSPPLVLTN